jgi:tetratricopeptide (TPR) repeat protein
MAFVIAALVLGGTAANAMMSEKPAKPDKPPGTEIKTEDGASSARQDAERYYGEAYDEIAKAKKEVAAGKTKNVEKRYKKAVDRGRQACEYDPTYHEAWNLVGYASRKLGKYDDALTAYSTCLKLQPMYAPARQYLGEAYLDMGKPDMAKEQLTYLERMEAPEELATLKAAFEAYEKAHPATNGSAAPTGTASADTTSGGK